MASYSAERPTSPAAASGAVRSGDIGRRTVVFLVAAVCWSASSNLDISSVRHRTAVSHLITSMNKGLIQWWYKGIYNPTKNFENWI